MALERTRHGGLRLLAGHGPGLEALSLDEPGPLWVALAEQEGPCHLDLAEHGTVEDSTLALFGIRSVLAHPLRTDDEGSLGVLAVLERDHAPVQARDRKILGIFAARASAELARLRAETELAGAREREAEIGGRIQQTLLHGRPPERTIGAAVAARSVPSQQIDGDFFDFVEFGAGRFDVIVGDVMGKGVPAALVGAATRGRLLRTLQVLTTEAEGGVPPRPGDIVSRAHEVLTPELVRLGSFVTACYARFHLEERRMTFVDLGHTKTLHVSAADGSCRYLEGSNLPLGVLEDEVYREEQFSFERGDLFLFYSDGVPETHGPDGELFGSERLAELVSKHAWMDPSVLIEGLMGALLEFSGRSDFEDDLTCVAVRIDEDAAVRPCEPIECVRVSRHTGLEHARDWRAWVREILRERASLAMRDDWIDELELALAEAVTNIVRHAFRGEPGELHGSMELWPDRVEIVLEHEGDPFNPDVVPEPLFDGTASGGFGVYLIEQCTDEVAYGPGRHGGRATRMVKRFPRGAEE